MTSWLDWFQMLGWAIVAVICAVVIFSVVMRPTRWAHRKPAPAASRSPESGPVGSGGAHLGTQELP